MLGNGEDSDDCAQEAFVKVYKALKHFKFEAKFSTWLYRITVNTCKNKLSSAEYRHRRGQVTIEKYPPDDEANQHSVEIADERNAPERAYEEKITRETIVQAVQSLSKDHKILIVLADLEGYSYEAMTQITGLGMGTLKSRLARARQQLRKKLEGVIRE
jgi:RNA polymerase sigma-70 factor (ECF subfamily)